jgi:undecaprenyl-diphosphatase
MKFIEKFIIGLSFYLIWLSVFVGLFVVLFWKGYLELFDAFVVPLVLSLRTNSLTFLMKIISFSADKYIIFFGSVILLNYFYRKQNKVLFNIFFLSVTGTYLLVYFFKIFFERARPIISLAEENSFSFPSGHATRSLAFWGVLIYFLLNDSNFKDIKNITTKKIIIFLLASLIILVGFSRIYLGAHWPIDVLGGYILAGSWLYFLIWVFKK